MHHQKCLKEKSLCTYLNNRWKQEIVNIYYVNKNNLYGCPHMHLDIGKAKLVAVLAVGAEISVLLERIFEDLLVKG